MYFIPIHENTIIIKTTTMKDTEAVEILFKKCIDELNTKCDLKVEVSKELLKELFIEMLHVLCLFLSNDKIEANP